MAGSSSHATTQDKGKGHVVAPPSPLALRILNQINDEIIDDPHLQVNDTRILIPFTIGADTHCFLGPIETLERTNKKLSFFPNAEGEDLLINQAFNISHFINQKSFRDNPKINPRGFDFTTWYQRFEPTKGAIWGALGIQELLRLSHFSLTTYPWMIGAVTCFWNRTTNNFHLLCGIIRMSLLDVVAITGLPIIFSDCTIDMQSQHQYNVTFNTSYSEFIKVRVQGGGAETQCSDGRPGARRLGKVRRGDSRRGASPRGTETPWPDKQWKRPPTTTTQMGPAQRKGDGEHTSKRPLQSMPDTDADDGPTQETQETRET
ncbi:hypothetical protein Ahy_B03g067574 [Arachis hypogaea]|uniref:Aminotransferase-like plant mobile domain-containing protein n=1 Tax=Arachis hypogaea TaxID=3818 RepID=A0A445A766_ARAHY|nr:hypothetical protein Ahy_B03g067574 [Arachis hypogaea]